MLLSLKKISYFHYRNLCKCLDERLDQSLQQEHGFPGRPAGAYLENQPGQIMEKFIITDQVGAIIKRQLTLSRSFLKLFINVTKRSDICAKL